MFVFVSRRALSILLLAFGASVLLRAPLLNRPLSGHHEFCTAFALIILENWHHDGIAAHGGAPPLTFNAPGDRAATWMGAGTALHEGRYYYLSFPPLNLYLAHAWCLLWGGPSVLALQAFNLLFHALTVIGLYLVMRAMVDEATSLATAMLYLFMPAPLWFQGNVFMSDIAVVMPWVWYLAVAMRVFHRKDFGHRSLALYGFSLAVTVYASWPGVIAAGVGALAMLHNWRRGKPGPWPVLLAITSVAVAIPIGLTFWAYLSVVDPGSLQDYLLGRFAQRSFAGAEERGLGYFAAQLLLNLRTGYLPVLVLLMLALPWVLHRAVKGDLHLPPGWRWFLLLAGLPVLLELILLLEYAEHDYVVLRIGPLCCGVGAWSIRSGVMGLRVQRWGTFLLVATMIAGAAYFWRINATGGSDRYRADGTFVATHIAPQQVFFWSGPALEPQLVWYAKRTPWSVSSVDEARYILQRTGQAQGVLFSPDPSGGDLQRTLIDARP
jgi:hypothetical protein